MLTRGERPAASAELEFAELEFAELEFAEPEFVRQARHFVQGLGLAEESLDLGPCCPRTRRKALGSRGSFVATLLHARSTVRLALALAVLS